MPITVQSNRVHRPTSKPLAWSGIEDAERTPARCCKNSRRSSTNTDADVVPSKDMDADAHCGTGVYVVDDIDVAADVNEPYVRRQST